MHIERRQYAPMRPPGKSYHGCERKSADWLLDMKAIRHRLQIKNCGNYSIFLSRFHNETSLVRDLWEQGLALWLFLYNKVVVNCGSIWERNSAPNANTLSMLARLFLCEYEILEKKTFAFIFKASYKCVLCFKSYKVKKNKTSFWGSCWT